MECLGSHPTRRARAMEGERAAILGQALVVAGGCAAIWYFVGNASGDASIISLVAAAIGSIAVIVAAFCILAWIFTGLGELIDDRRARIRAEEASRRYEIEAAARAAEFAKLEAARERHRANRVAWLRTARETIARQPPAWDAENRAAFSWLYARLGKTVTIRSRMEERIEGTHDGERPGTSEELEPTE